jgi:hypothetical protein
LGESDRDEPLDIEPRVAGNDAGVNDGQALRLGISNRLVSSLDALAREGLAEVSSLTVRLPTG